MINLYQILGISPNSSTEEIKTAFKQLAIKYHPDKNAGSLSAEERFKEINNAYQILADPDKRSTYDKLLQQSQYQYSQAHQATGRYRDKYYQRKAQGNYNYQQQAQSSSSKENKKVKPPMTKWEVTAWIIGGLIGAFLVSWTLKTSLKMYDARLKYEEAEHEYYINHNEFSAQNLLSVAIGRDPDYAEPYLLYGKIISETKGEAQQAIHLLSTGIRLAGETSSEYYFYRAKAYLSLDNKKEAAADLRIVIEEQPTHEEAHFLLGEIELYYNQHYKSALEHFNQVLSMHPQSQKAHLHKGVALQKLFRYKSSQESLSKALQFNSKEGAIFYYMGINDLQYFKDTINACHLWYHALDLGVLESNWYIRKYCDGIE